MEKHPLISIITVVYNGEKTIEQTINSVLGQTYQNIEYIIVDGKSTDGTMQIVSKYKDKIAKIISEKDKGIYDAMNKGIAAASGEIIGLVNADDFYEKDALQTVAMHYKPGLNNYYGALRNITGYGSFIAPARRDLDKLKRGMVVNHPSLFVNKEVYDKIGKFDVNFRIGADWDFTLRSYINNVDFVKIDKILSNFRIGGVSGAITKKYLQEMSDIRKKNKVYTKVDRYYILDSIKFLLFGKYLYKLFLIKNKLKNAE